MLPGKHYTPEAVVAIVRARIWLLLIPLAVCAAATAMYARSIPNEYWAETTILVVPQRVPEAYVKSTVTETVEDRLRSIKPVILSRTRLERIIVDFDLYPGQRQGGMLMEDVVGLMRRNVSVDTRNGDSFSISYVGSRPEQVMNVTNRLASLFIDESLRDRRSQAEGTDKFLESQLIEAKAKLVDKEKRLETYRREHAGELPSQLESNLQQVATAQARVGTTRDSINRDRDRRLILEQQLADMEKGNYVEPTAPPGSIQGEAGGSLQQQLLQAEAQLAAQEARGLKAGHPDLELTKRRVRDLRAQSANDASAVAAGSARLSATEFERRRRIAELQGQINEVDSQIARKQDDEKRLEAAAAEAQRRADALPTRESELTELTRDYATLQDSYNSLLRKKQESQIASNLEERQVGEQFKLLDPARLPERPSSPNRVRINAIGAALGLGLGVLVVAFLEYRDRTFKTDRELSRLIGLPVLAVIPVMQSISDRRRAFWQALMLNSACGGVVIGSAIVFGFAVTR